MSNEQDPPAYVTGEDDFDDEPDQYDHHIYNTFVKEMEDAGFEIYHNYSGRGQFGERCPAVQLDEGPDELVRAIRACTTPVRWDSLGLGTVLYPWRI